MPSDLNQELYLGAVLPGLTFTVIEVTPHIPDRTGWSASFTNIHAGSTASNEYGDFDSLRCPFEVGGGEQIGTTKLRSNSGLWCTGQGGKVDIKFQLEGWTKIKGEQVHINGTGYISVSASDWKGVERPDVSNVTYFWPNAPPCNAALSVPPTIAGMPDDILFFHAAKPDAKELGMTSTTHKEMMDTLLDYAIRGIFFLNQKLFGWAVGKF